MVQIKESNPDRITGYEKDGHLPNMSFVRRFAKRNNLTLRKTYEISKGRQVLSVSDIRLWQSDTKSFLFSTEELSEAMSDPTRVFNQDESSIEMGSTSQNVLAERNVKVLYSVSSGSREHVTASYMVNAAGDMVPPRLIYKGVRNIAQEKLKDLPKEGKSGKWTFSVSERGFITRELFIVVLKDLDCYLTQNNIKRPVILFVDGASPHISLQAAEFCKSQQIQPWLLRPNSTHILQPLDLTFFRSLKQEMKRLTWLWQTNPQNAGQSMNKYSVVTLLRQATENCLHKETLVPSGFRVSGLVPWNPDAPNFDKLRPSDIFAHDKDTGVASNENNSVRSLTYSRGTPTLLMCKSKMHCF